MLPTFNLPGKNISPDRQMAMMRTYLNQLKDDTESELYDIKWDNLSKPLREKIDSLDRYQVQNDEMMNYLSANMITADTITANYIAAKLVDSHVITSSMIKTYTIVADNIATNAITSSKIEANAITSSKILAGAIGTDQLAANCITAAKINAGAVGADAIASNAITAGKINAGAITSAKIDTNTINGKYFCDQIDSDANAYFSNLVVNSNGVSLRVGRNKYNLTVRSVNSGGNTIYFLGTTTNPV